MGVRQRRPRRFDSVLPARRRPEDHRGPGLRPGQRAILDPLAELGYEAGDITDVIFSHWHPDHTYNAGLFPNAQAHDFWGVYKNDTWLFRFAEGYQVSRA